MLPLRKLRAYAYRAIALMGKTGRQSKAAKQQRAKFYESIWREAARELDCQLEILDTNFIRIADEQSATRVWLNYACLDDPVALRVAGNKPLVHRLLQEQGLETPAHAVFGLHSFDIAREFLKQHHSPCVVKPASGTGAGQGVTTGICNDRQLRQAAFRAGGYASDLIIEKQMSGANLRLLYLDGQLLDAVERQPPQVTGDGKRTIRQLIDNLNEQRLDRGHEVAQVTLPIDLDLKQTLAQQKLSLRSIPDHGRVVTLKTVINDNMADENVSVINQISSELIESGRQAARAVGLRLAVVDFVTPDYTKPLSDVGGVILEVNSTPGFHIHYAQRNGRCPVAVPVLRACLEWTGSETSRQAPGIAVDAAPQSVSAW